MNHDNIALFESKFSQIHLNHRNNLDKKISPTRRKKVLYPPHLYPVRRDTGRQISKELSPAPVANLNSNKYDMSRAPVTPKRTTSATNSDTQNKQTNLLSSKNPFRSDRTVSYPVPDKISKKSDGQFSFMRETSSSLQKKQVLTPVNEKRTTSGRSSSVGLSSTKKRLEYSRQLSQRSKRHISNSLINKSNHDFSDFENSHTGKYRLSLESSPEEYYQLNTDDIVIDESPSKPRRRVTQPLPKTDNVFDRLYPKSLKHPTAKLPTTKPNKETQTLKSIPRLKIESISQLHQYLYIKNPQLFRDDTLEEQLQAPYDIQESDLDGLSMYEKGELARKKEIYYVPKRPLRQIAVNSQENNFGFDDNKGNYIIIPEDHINYRYEIISVLGTGSFGNVVMANDHKTNRLVAVKIINNHVNWSLQQSINEIKLLKNLQDRQKTLQNSNIISILDNFNFRSHMCIITELLSTNLYSMLELTNFQGFGYDLLRYITKQILTGLQFIHDANIIHCDIKPENIMIKLPPSPNHNWFQIKIIDFGSSCFVNETSFTYIQSRYYRAPEVLLGTSYDQKIDIWSLGCLVVELFTGVPLLPGKNEYDQLGLVVELFGVPKPQTILKLRNKLTKKTNQVLIASNDTVVPLPSILDKNLKRTLIYKVFDHNGKINLTALSQYYNDSNAASVNKFFKISSKTLEGQIGLHRFNLKPEEKERFLEFLLYIFVWDPSERRNTHDLLNTSFLE